MTITVQEVRNYLEGFGIDANKVSDVWIQKRIDSAIANFERMSGKSFGATKAKTILMDGNNLKTLQLPYSPIISVTSVKILYAAVPDIILAEADYVVNNDLAQISLQHAIIPEEGVRIWNFPTGDNNIEVTFTYGYSEDQNDLKDALIQMTAAKTLNKVGGEDGGVASLSVEGYSKTFGDGGVKYSSIVSSWTNEAKNVLKAFRQIV